MGLVLGTQTCEILLMFLKVFFVSFCLLFVFLSSFLKVFIIPFCFLFHGELIFAEVSSDKIP